MQKAGFRFAKLAIFEWIILSAIKTEFANGQVCDHPLPSYAKAQLIAGDDVPYYEHGHVLTYICNCNESHGVAMSPFTCTCDAMADPLNPVWRCIYRNVTSACIATSTTLCSSITCGANADCVIEEEIPICVCRKLYKGNPHVACEAYCETESFIHDSIIYSFPETWGGQLANSFQTCPDSGRAIASIACNQFDFHLASLVVIPCNETLENFAETFLDNVQFDEDGFEEAATSLQVLTSSYDSGVEMAESILDFFREAETQISEITPTALINTLTVLQRVGESLLENTNNSNSGSSLAQTIETFIDKVVLPEDQEFLDVQTNDISARIMSTNVIEISGSGQIEVENLPDYSGDIIVRDSGGLVTERPVSYVIPGDALEKAHKNNPNFSGQLSVAYFGQNFFPSNLNVSQPVSISLGPDATITNLQNPIIIQFVNQPYQYEKNPDVSNPRKAIRTELGCRFWDFELDDWSSVGCCLNQTQNPPVCQCDHLTNFALLVATTSVPNDVTLEKISFYGCLVSIVGLVLTILMHALIRERFKHRTTKIFLNICANLLAGYMVFVLGVEEVSSGPMCTAIAALMQFFFIATWCWMCLYIYNLYVLLLQVTRNSSDRIFLIRAFLFGYGLPFFITVTNVASTVGYLDTLDAAVTCDGEILLPMSLYRAENMCWIHGKSLYLGFLLPVGILLLLNIFFYCIILRKAVWNQNKIGSTASTKTITKRLFISLTLLFSTGLTWIFGYLMLASTDPSYFTIFNWVFALTSSMQGILIFIMTCIFQTNVRNGWKQPMKRWYNRLLMR